MLDFELNQFHINLPCALVNVHSSATEKDKCQRKRQSKLNKKLKIYEIQIFMYTESTSVSAAGEKIIIYQQLLLFAFAYYLQLLQSYNK